MELVDNPDYDIAYRNFIEAFDAVNAAIAAGIDDPDLANAYYYYMDILDHTPEKLEEVSQICEHEHTTHSIRLAFFTKEDVMNALGFTDSDKQWQALTETYFENL